MQTETMAGVGVAASSMHPLARLAAAEMAVVRQLDRATAAADRVGAEAAAAAARFAEAAKRAEDRLAMAGMTAMRSADDFIGWAERMAAETAEACAALEASLEGGETVTHGDGAEAEFVGGHALFANRLDGVTLAPLPAESNGHAEGTPVAAQDGSQVAEATETPTEAPQSATGPLGVSDWGVAADGLSADWPHGEVVPEPLPEVAPFQRDARKPGARNPAKPKGGRGKRS